MIKVEVIEEFTLAKFDEIKDSIERKSKAIDGRLFVGDVFECNEDMVEYLTTGNKLGRAFVKIIEVVPSEEKPKKTTTKKETKSKKTIAKK